MHADRAEIVARTAFCRDWEQLAHTARVVEQLRAMGDASDEEEAIGWLHDVVEDTDVDYVDLVDMGFSNLVIEGVRLVTRDGDFLHDYHGYKSRLLYADGAVGRAARRVKLADARENLERCRAARGVPKWARLAETRYAPLVEQLEARLSIA
jgi:(p)ppGpp synthase/HD superfamily hydrolase